MGIWQDAMTRGEECLQENKRKQAKSKERGGRSKLEISKQMHQQQKKRGDRHGFLTILLTSPIRVRLIVAPTGLEAIGLLNSAAVLPRDIS